MVRNQYEMCRTGVRLPPARRSQQTVEGVIVFQNVSLHIIKTNILADELHLMHLEGGEVQ